MEVGTYYLLYYKRRRTGSFDGGKRKLCLTAFILSVLSLGDWVGLGGLRIEEIV